MIRVVGPHLGSPAHLGPRFQPVPGDPLTFAVVGASALGATLETVGVIQQAGASSAAHKANARIAEEQARIAREQAAEEQRNAAIRAEIFAREARRRQGQRLSAIASSGLALSGSAIDILIDAAMNDEQQRLFILHEGAERARARLQGANVELMTAMEQRRQAAAERRAGILEAGATLIGRTAQTFSWLDQSPEFNKRFRRI